MARPRNSKAAQEIPEVTFSIEVRPATFAQLEAGRRLFGKLISRAQSQIEQEKSPKAKSQAKGTRSAPGGTAKPPPDNPPH